jgi:integrase
MEEIRQAQVYGVRPKRTFKQTVIKYLDESDKASLCDDVLQIKLLVPFIGNLPLEGIHMGTLQPFIQARKEKGVKNRTINYGLQTVRHILNLATEWMDANGLTWLAAAPRIKFLPESDRRAPYPLSWDEQFRFFNELPQHLSKMALFKVNTGCREAEVCRLKWEWEQEIPELSTSVFVIPSNMVKNREPRVVVLNRIALAVVNEMRGTNPDYVFTYKGRPIRKMNGPAWRNIMDPENWTVS